MADDMGSRLLAAVERSALPPKIESHDAQTTVWHFTGRNVEAPAMLRLIADRLERDRAALIGLWVTGFGDPLDLDIQVVVDAVRPGVPGDQP